MKIYGIVGTSQQTIVESNSYTPIAGEVLMQSARPDGEYIAQADGTWKAVEPAPIEPTLDERVDVLETQQSESDEVIMALVEMIDAMSADK